MRPPYIERLLSGVGRCAHRHRMIFPGDRILVGLSGGKDSLATAFSLAQRRGKGGVQYELAALMVDWEEFPAPADAVERLAEWLKTLSIPFIHKKLKFADISHTETFSCYACSRARRRLLFEEAMKRGFGTVALGHTLDDFAATALMNLCFRGRLEPLMPRRDFFGGKLRVIRPLCEIREGTISTLAERLGFPVFKVECPKAESTLRDRLRPIVAQLLKIDTLVRENCYRAWFGPEGGKTGTGEAQYEEGR